MVSEGQFVGLDWNRIARLQVNRLTPKIQISALCAGRKRLLPRLSPITFSFVLLSLSLVPTWGCSMGLMKDNSLN